LLPGRSFGKRFEAFEPGYEPDMVRTQRERQHRQAAWRRLETIHTQLGAVTARRTQLWGELAENSDPRTAQEIEALSSLIETLWSEARRRRACLQHGSPEVILDRARREMFFDRSLEAVANKS
jgi:nucleotidyltransferase/DNA polymerase involved in DNA repair